MGDGGSYGVKIMLKITFKLKSKPKLRIRIRIRIQEQAQVQYKLKSEIKFQVRGPIMVTLSPTSLHLPLGLCETYHNDNEKGLYIHIHI